MAPGSEGGSAGRSRGTEPSGADDDAEGRGARRARQPVVAFGGTGSHAMLTVQALADRPGLRLEGEIDLATRDDLEGALRPFLRGSDDVHLELDGLRFIDAGGAAVLTRFAAQVRPRRRVVVHRPPRQLVRVVSILWPDDDTLVIDPW